MMPYVAADVNKKRDLKDSLVRYPMGRLTWKSIYARASGRKGRY
jgi:hypothetical protein